MMIMAAVGYALVKLGLIKQEDSKVLTVLLVYALQPCLIFRSLQIDLTPERAAGFTAALIFAFSCMFIAAIFSNLLRKPLRLDPVDMCTLMFANVGNLVLPVIAMMLGSEMTFYCAGFQMPFNLFTWIYGYMLMSGRRDVPVRKIVFNPNLIALFLGFIFLLTGLKMPAVIDTAMEGLQQQEGLSDLRRTSHRHPDPDHPDPVCHRLPEPPSPVQSGPHGDHDRRGRAFSQFGRPALGPDRPRRPQGRRLQCHDNSPVRFDHAIDHIHLSDVLPHVMYAIKHVNTKKRAVPEKPGRLFLNNVIMSLCTFLIPTGCAARITGYIRSASV